MMRYHPRVEAVMERIAFMKAQAKLDEEAKLKEERLAEQKVLRETQKQIIAEIVDRAMKKALSKKSKPKPKAKARKRTTVKASQHSVKQPKKKLYHFVGVSHR